MGSKVKYNQCEFIDIDDLKSLVYQEYINLDNVNKIMTNWNTIKSNLPINRFTNENKLYDPILSLKKILRNNSPVNHVSYAPSKNLKYYGRLFAQSASLQNLPRELRGAIATDYIDVDMKNAHPTILLNYCKINNIKCDNLEYYILNRDTVLEDLTTDLNYTRDEGKHLFLTFINGGKRQGLNIKYLIDFQAEMDEIHTKISELNRDIKKEISRRKTDNLNASICNHILCRQENICLLYAVQFLKSLNFNIDVLIFDGFMVRKNINNVLSLTDDILTDTSDYIETKTGYKIDFVIKPLDNSIDLTNLNISNVDINETYYQDKEEFEKSHIKILFPPMYITTFKDKQSILQSQDEIIKSYTHLKTNKRHLMGSKESISRVSFIKEWIHDEFIRRKDNITFKPSPLVEEPNEYNTFRDFEIRKIKLNEDFDINNNQPIKRFIDFIDNLMGNRSKYTNYLMALIANIIQNTGIRACVCIVLYSIVEGVGKSILCDLIHKLIGDDYCFDATDIQNGLFGKHSMAEFEKLFVSLVEVKEKDTHLNSEVFKARKTDTFREY
jgi:hypothetical protein